MICFRKIAGKVALSAILSILILSCLSLHVEATSPSGVTHQFYGTVTGSSGLVGAGYSVTAMVDGQQVASTTTDARGQWGYSPLFVVTAPSSSNIEFYVNGVLSGTAAGCISTNRLDLVYNAPVKPSSSADAVAAFQGSGGTLTFFIGKQAQTTAQGKSTPLEQPGPVSVPPVTSIAVTELLATPREADAGTDITITVRLLNRGNTEFSGGVVLKINDIVDQQKDITIATGESRALAFPVNKSEPGNYRVTVDDYSTDFVIRQHQAASILQFPAASQTSIQPGAATVTHDASQQKENRLIPDNPWIALAVIVVGGIIAIYLVIVIVRQGSSRY